MTTEVVNTFESEHTELIIMTWCLGIGYILRCRSLRYLHNRGLKARGCVNRVETEPRYITDLYHGLRGPDNAMYSTIWYALRQLSDLVHKYKV